MKTVAQERAESVAIGMLHSCMASLRALAELDEAFKALSPELRDVAAQFCSTSCEWIEGLHRRNKHDPSNN